MKEIQLTRGKVALIDDEDFEKVNKYNWCALDGESGLWYARSTNKIHVRMHSLIMNEYDLEIDHKDNNGLNNQKNNLRICTGSQNCSNRRKLTGLSSRFKGVSFRKDNYKWRAYIKQYGVMYNLGSFNKEEDAALAYNEAAKELFGEFARLNEVLVA